MPSASSSEICCVETVMDGRHVGVVKRRWQCIDVVGMTQRIRVDAADIAALCCAHRSAKRHITARHLALACIAYGSLCRAPHLFSSFLCGCTLRLPAACSTPAKPAHAHAPLAIAADSCDNAAAPGLCSWDVAGSVWWVGQAWGSYSCISRHQHVIGRRGGDGRANSASNAQHGQPVRRRGKYCEQWRQQAINKQRINVRATTASDHLEGVGDKYQKHGRMVSGGVVKTT